MPHLEVESKRENNMYPKITMKTWAQAALCILSLFLTHTVSAQSYGEWTWESGDTTTNTGASYGLKGTPAASNKPGNRDSHSGWKDPSGNFWIFGGEDYSQNVYDDLWEYSPSTGWWTWVSGSNAINNPGTYGTQGIAAAGNVPGGRLGQAGFSDPSGNFWIFGGTGKDDSGNYGQLNDLWEYSPSSGKWTWASGSSTANSQGVYGAIDYTAAGYQPGGRKAANGLADASGNLWIFGGFGYDGAGNVGYLGDMWTYNPSANRWAWFAGSNTINNVGVYGTKGTANPANMPGARYGAAAAIDASGNIWVFGGFGYDAAGNVGYLNDLWEFSTHTDEWTWIGGGTTVNGAAVYGTQGTAAATSMPGARFSQNMVIDGGGHIWIFGGEGIDGNGNQGLLNDLWAYSPTTHEWNWVSGSNIRNQPGVFGTEGLAALTNEPPGRALSTAWVDASSNIWVMGGGNFSSADRNDLWKFNLVIPLALDNIQLQGHSHDGANLLNWETMEETGPANFNVERSTDGTTFTDLGTVAALGSGAIPYLFTDSHPPAVGNAFYRIKIVAASGNIGYSSTIVLTAVASCNVGVFPNPTMSGVTLNIGKADLLNTPVKLFAIDGRLIGAQLITSPQQYLDLSHFPPATYVLQFADGTALELVKQ